MNFRNTDTPGIAKINFENLILIVQYSNSTQSAIIYNAVALFNFVVIINGSLIRDIFDLFTLVHDFHA